MSFSPSPHKQWRLIEGVGLVPAAPGLQIFPPVIITGDLNKLVLGRNVRIDSFAKIDIGDGVTICDDTHICSFTHVNIGGGKTFIGARCSISSGAKIVSGTNDPDAQSATATAPETSRVLRTSVVLGDDVTLFVNAVVLPDAALGSRSRVAAGGVVTQHQYVDPDAIVGGVPARFIRWRTS